MRYLAFIGAVLLGMISAASAQTPVRVSGSYTALGHCQISAATLASAVTLTTANCAAGTVPASATMAEICVEAAGIRYLDDGTSPTASLGIPVVAQSSTIPTCFSYAVKPLTGLTMILISGSPVVTAAFYK
jgi:hypothetical protein